MPGKFEVKHLDSNIIIGAFFPDKKDIERDNDRLCSRFLNWICDHELNTKLRMSLVAYGEVLYKMQDSKDQRRIHSGYDRFIKYTERMGERFEIYSPKLEGSSEDIDKAIHILKKRDMEIRKYNADALIVAHAMVDKDASSIYTMDGHLLSGVEIETAVRIFRKNRSMRSLAIRPVNDHEPTNEKTR